MGILRISTPTVRTPDRRSCVRGTVNGEPQRTQLERMILGTYSEMPGLLLTLPQAARLFGLRQETCRVVLDDLTRRHVLRCTEDGQYGYRGCS
jgi:hypothetical protein